MIEKDPVTVLPDEEADNDLVEVPAHRLLTQLLKIITFFRTHPDFQKLETDHIDPESKLKIRDYFFYILLGYIISLLYRRTRRLIRKIRAPFVRLMNQLHLTLDKRNSNTSPDHPTGTSKLPPGS